MADQLAAEGFIAVAPDLLSGKGPGGKGSTSVLGLYGAGIAFCPPVSHSFPRLAWYVCRDCTVRDPLFLAAIPFSAASAAGNVVI